MSNHNDLPVITRKLLGIIDIRFKLITETGLLIRSSQEKASIGGIDTEPMIAKKKYFLISKGSEDKSSQKHEEVEVDVPFIPGSSLKGRMRSLLELYEGAELYFDGKIYMHYRNLSPGKQACKNLDHALDNLFGMPSIQLSELIKHSDKLPVSVQEAAMKIAPTRLIVEDIFPSEEYVQNLYMSKGLVNKEDFLEEKAENRIDRITSAADPRFIVRVKPGVEFEGNMKLLLFNIDLEKPSGRTKIEEYLDLLFAGMRLVEETFLGGSGTRGYGKVVFKDIELVLKTPGYYRGIEEPVVLAKLERLQDYESVKKEILGKILEKLAGQAK